jgi:DNA-binding NarL/FixJ family response regulator
MDIPPPTHAAIGRQGEWAMTIRVYLAEDHQIVRDGLRSILAREGDLEVIGEAANGRIAVEEAGTLLPDVVIMDVSMPELNGIEATRMIRANHPDSRVVALSAHADKQYVLGMLKAGASGYVCKDSASDELVSAIRAVNLGRKYVSPQVAGILVDGCFREGTVVASQGHAQLGPRERQVVQLLAEGHSSKEIAARMHIAMRTVESHRRNIMRKLMLHSVAELTKYALREGLTSLDN